MSKLATAGTRIGAASLELASNRDSAAMADRFKLSRVVLSQLPNFEDSALELGGPLTETVAGQRDLQALADTLSPQVWGSKIRVRSAREPRSAPNWEIPSAA